jgi:hypothetical protein
MARFRRLGEFIVALAADFPLRAHDLTLVFRDRAAKSYQTSLALRRGDSLSVAAFPEITFKIEDLLG